MKLGAYKNAFDIGILADWQATADVPEYLKHLWDPLWPILHGGKRIRGYLAEVGLGDITGTSKLGLALEALHAFALVHDDIMDRADTRRGHRSVHSALGADNPHVGVSYGILLGDWLLVESYGALEDFFLDAGIAPEHQISVRKTFRILLQEMVAGQMMDIALESDVNLPEAYITEKTKLKTALYTFVRPLMLGLQSRGATDEILQWVLDWGTAVGLGFQVQDDLLDLIGEPKHTGKPAMTDISENSGTYYRWWILTHGQDADKNLLMSCLGNDKTTNEKQSELRDMLERSGAIDAGKKLISQYYQTGRMMLDASPLSEDQNACLAHVMDLLTDRKA